MGQGLNLDRVPNRPPDHAPVPPDHGSLDRGVQQSLGQEVRPGPSLGVLHGQGLGVRPGQGQEGRDQARQRASMCRGAGKQGGSWKWQVLFFLLCNLVIMYWERSIGYLNGAVLSV